MEGEFQLVTKQHRLCSKKRHCYSVRDRASFTVSSKSCDQIYDTILDIKNQNIIIHYVSYLEDILRATITSSINEVVCYGIGQISEDKTAQYQLGVLLRLIDNMKIKRVLIYDPVLGVEEMAALSRLGIETIQSNELCRRAVHTSTLFFMIHCSKAMYNNLLYSNWNTTQLSHVTIIGNCFSSYHLRLTEKQLTDEAYYILKIKGGYKEVPLPKFTLPNIFNDTAVHTFPSDRLQLIDGAIWKDNPEPCLDPKDEEMIVHTGL